MLTRVRHSLTARTLLGSAVLAVILVVAFAVLVIAVGNLRSVGRVALRAQEAVTVGTELERSAVSLENGLRRFVSSGREADLAPFTTARARYPEQVARLKTLARDDPQLRADVDRVETLISDYIGLWALPFLETARENPAYGRAYLDDPIGLRRIADVRRALGAMFVRARSEADATERRADSRADLALRLAFVGIALVIITALGAAAVLRRRIVVPIQRVAGASTAIAGGDLGARVDTKRSDELGDLARAFNAMAAALERQATEITERTDELERSNRELDDYASVTSHDLQGPLVTIGMYAGLLERKLTDDADAQALATHIRAGSERMRDLTRDLLAYARLDREESKSEAVDLDETVRDVRDALAGPLRDRGAEVTVSSLPTVRGDAGRLHQVFQNLLANAIKFIDAERPPRVEITATAMPGGMTRISVHDNGIGFAEGQADLIFRPFQRLHSADRYEGSGIGLAVCERIVAQHGGRIWAEGAPGRGATFHLTLPVVAQPARAKLVGAGGLPT